jgi:hypothetical protein
MKKQIKEDLNLIDCHLHPIGVMQCENHQAAVNDIDWKIVYVSPMTRTL